MHVIIESPTSLVLASSIHPSTIENGLVKVLYVAAKEGDHVGDNVTDAIGEDVELD